VGEVHRVQATPHVSQVEVEVQVHHEVLHEVQVNPHIAEAEVEAEVQISESTLHPQILNLHPRLILAAEIKVLPPMTIVDLYPLLMKHPRLLLQIQLRRLHRHLHRHLLHRIPDETQHPQERRTYEETVLQHQVLEMISIARIEEGGRGEGSMCEVLRERLCMIVSLR
jgi:hypothetical protein